VPWPLVRETCHQPFSLVPTPHPTSKSPFPCPTVHAARTGLDRPHPYHRRIGDGVSIRCDMPWCPRHHRNQQQQRWGCARSSASRVLSAFTRPPETMCFAGPTRAHRQRLVHAGGLAGAHGYASPP